MNLTIEDRAREIAAFLGKPYEECLAKLRLGFGPLHNEVTADWRRANPQTDDEILEWYRTTEAYIWELSAYHLDPGFNYMGMVGGISEALRAKGVHRVLCLGDGIGDLSMLLMSHMFDARYHDLWPSRTASFAELRMAMHGWTQPYSLAIHCSQGWYPSLGLGWDAIVSLDFLEHCTRPDEWLRAIYAALKPGGWFLGQHAFGIGSTKDGGSMPMHLDRNDKYETEYGPLMLEIGFVQEGTSNWWRKSL